MERSDPRPPPLRLDRRILGQAALRLLLAVAFFAGRWIPWVDEALATAGAVASVAWAAYVVLDWVRTSDWEHDRRVTAQGHRTAPARRQEAREISAHIREQKRLVRERRRAGRA